MPSRGRGHAINYPEKPWVPLACADCGGIIAYMEPAKRGTRAKPKVVCPSCHTAEM